jgi:hypothetical protein
MHFRRDLNPFAEFVLVQDLLFEGLIAIIGNECDAAGINDVIHDAVFAVKDLESGSRNAGGHEYTGQCDQAVFAGYESHLTKKARPNGAGGHDGIA